MSNFKIHKSAVQLEHCLNLMMQTSKQDEVAEITRIYDAPVKVCTEVLDSVHATQHLDTIELIKQKYWPYQELVLSQLEEKTRVALCEDMLFIQQSFYAK